MSVSAVQNNQNKTHQPGYLKAGAIGALSGYALKFALPITPQEKDEQFSLYLDDVRKKAAAVKKDTIKNINNIEPRTQAVDEFINMCENNDVNIKKIKSYKEPLLSQVMEFVRRVNEAARDVKKYGKEIFTAHTKYIRPTATFIGIGAFAGIAYSFVSNTLSKMSTNKN